MSTVKIRNINPLGYVDLPLIGRSGPAPYLVCHDPENCHDEHEHTQVVGEEHGQPGSGGLVPGEEFEVPADIAEQLLAQVGNFERVTPKKSDTKADDTAVTAKG